MPAPPVYLDQCVDYAVAEAWRQRGFSVFTVRDEEAPGNADPEQRADATARGWLRLAPNRRDFRRLPADYQRHQRPHSGIILLPQRSHWALRTLRAAMMFDWLPSLPDYRSPLFTWGHLQRQLERGQRLRGYSEEEHLIDGGLQREEEPPHYAASRTQVPLTRRSPPAGGC